MRNTKTVKSPAAFSVAQLVTSQEVTEMLAFIKNFQLKYADRKAAVLRKKK
jgi:hypothetical protein